MRATDAPRSLAPAASSLAAWSVLLGVSGAAALVEEVVWTRWLTLSLGASSRATVIVLATFMGGLGLGAWIGGRLADRLRARGLVAFAAIEALTGVWALLAIPLLGRWLPEASAALAHGLGTPVLPLPGRVVLATLTLVPPTLLMGASLPLLARWAIDAGIAPGRGIGVLYTWNTLGGALGTLAAVFLLVERLGLTGTALVAAGAQVAVSLAAWACARGARTGAHAVSAKPAEHGRSAIGRELADRLWLAAALAAFASGLVGLGTEVAVHRILAVLAGSSVYAFAAMLAAYLIGIAGGAALGARIADRMREPGTALAFVLGALALGVALSLRLLATGAWQAVGRGASSYALEVAGSLVVLLPATLALGATIPLVGRAAAAVSDTAGRRFGTAYALNTAGAVLGAVAAGLLLVPRIGTARSLLLFASIAAAAGLAVAVLGAPARHRRGALAGVLAAAVAAFLLGYGVDPARHELLARYTRTAPLAFEEGPVQTIAVVRQSTDQQLEFLRLVTNQTSLTGTNLYGQRYMRLLGHLPVLWAETPRRVLIICFGTGMTTGAVAAHAAPERIDVAEISPEVLRAAPLFAAANGDVLDDRRVRVVIDDGRHVLLAAREPWDAITLEPPPPRDSGVVSLYTREFYELALARLAPGGVVAQWIPLHSQSEAEVRMLARTFAESFPHVLGFLPVERDLLLLGARQPLVRDLGALARGMHEPRVRESLAEVGLDDPAELLATALVDRARLLAWAAGAPEVLDDRPRVEYFARYGRAPAWPSTAGLRRAPLPLEALVAGGATPEIEARFSAARAAWALYLSGADAHEAGRHDQGYAIALATAERAPRNRFYQWAAMISDAHLARFAARARAGHEPAQAWELLARGLAARGRWNEAREASARAAALRAGAAAR